MLNDNQHWVETKSLLNREYLDLASKFYGAEHGVYFGMRSVFAEAIAFVGNFDFNSRADVEEAEAMMLEDVAKLRRIYGAHHGDVRHIEAVLLKTQTLLEMPTWADAPYWPAGVDVKTRWTRK